MNDIQNSILQTLNWFEILRRPLTVDELYRNLWKCECSEEDFRRELHDLIDSGIVYLMNTGNMPPEDFVLRSKPGAHEVWEQYVNRAPEREFFERRIQKLQRVLKWIPFIRSIYVVNSVAFGGIRKGSDLDLFVVIRDGYMWLGRALVTLVISCMGIRRHDEKITNRVCLSFFVTESAMNLENIRIKAHDDIYLVYWILWARPIIIRRDRSSPCPQNVLPQENSWITKYVPNIQHHDRSGQACLTTTIFAMIFECVLFFTGIAWISNQILRYFLKKRALRKHEKSSSRASIIISDEILKFHEEDRREEYWKKLLKEV